jgi:hypothetical protein
MGTGGSLPGGKARPGREADISEVLTRVKIPTFSLGCDAVWIRRQIATFREDKLSTYEI